MFKAVANYPGVQKRVSEKRRYNGRPDVCFYIRYKVGGILRREKVGWLSEGYSAKIAAEIRAQRMKDLRHGKTVKTQAEINREKQIHNITLEKIKDHYFESRGASLKGRVTDLNRWQKHLTCIEKKRVPELTELDIERIKRNMNHLQTSTIRNTLELLRRIINYGVKRNLCPPLRFTIKLPLKDNQVTEYLTAEESERLLAVLDSWPNQEVSRMVKLALLTGMRRGEIFKLKVEDIDFHQDIIKLVDPKGGRDATVPMSGPVRKLLQEQIKSRRYQDSPFVFPGKDGRQRVDCSAVKRIKEKARLPKNFRPFHGLRHNFAVQMVSSGQVSLDQVADLLTHKDTRITQRYADFLPEARKKTAEKAAELIMKSPSKVVNINTAKK